MRLLLYMGACVRLHRPQIYFITKNKFIELAHTIYAFMFRLQCQNGNSHKANAHFHAQIRRKTEIENK